MFAWPWHWPELPSQYGKLCGREKWEIWGGKGVKYSLCQWGRIINLYSNVYTKLRLVIAFSRWHKSIQLLIPSGTLRRMHVGTRAGFIQIEVLLGNGLANYCLQGNLVCGLFFTGCKLKNALTFLKCYRKKQTIYNRLHMAHKSWKYLLFGPL